MLAFPTYQPLLADTTRHLYVHVVTPSSNGCESASRIITRLRKPILTANSDLSGAALHYPDQQCCNKALAASAVCGGAAYIVSDLALQCLLSHFSH